MLPVAWKYLKGSFLYRVLQDEKDRHGRSGPLRQKCLSGNEEMMKKIWELLTKIMNHAIL